MDDKAIEAAARAVCKANHYKPEECDCERNKSGPCAENVDLASAAIAAYEAALGPLNPGPIADMVNENTRLRTLLDAYRQGLVIDIHMGGPRFMGANSSALKRAWEMDKE